MMYIHFIYMKGEAMQAQIVKWGNGQGIRIPKSLLTEAGININDYFNITAEKNRIILEKTFRHRSLEERAASFGGKLGPYETFDWGEPEGREIW